jgi:AcrR family transcriptional regulator
VAKDTLQIRKQQLVRDAIYDAAIELFAEKGFDETTVEEVAQAAGVSRRSFFRYFASKDDLLAQNVLLYGAALIAAIKECPATFSPFEIVQETVLTVVKQVVAQQQHTRQVIEIAERSISARQAQGSRMMEVEDRVAKAFAERLKGGGRDKLTPRVLANLTLSVMGIAIISWFRDEYQDLSVAATQVLSGYGRVFCDRVSATRGEEEAVPVRGAVRSAARRRPREKA